MSYRSKHLQRSKINNKTFNQGHREVEKNHCRSKNGLLVSAVSQGAILGEGNNPQAIIERLQKHIQYLERKLTGSEADVSRLADIVATLQHRCWVKDEEVGELTKRLTQQQKLTEDLVRRYEGFEGTGMAEKLRKRKSWSPNGYKRELSRLKCKPGSFSAAFLPTGFSSVYQIKGHKSEAFEGLTKDVSSNNLHQNDARVGNVSSSSLTKEWGKERRGKEASGLAVKHSSPARQVSSEKSLGTVLKRAQLRLGGDGLRRGNRLKGGDRLIEHLRLTEQQVGWLMEYVSEQDDTFTTADIRGESVEWSLQSGVCEFMYSSTKQGQQTRQQQMKIYQQQHKNIEQSTKYQKTIQYLKQRIQKLSYIQEQNNIFKMKKEYGLNCQIISPKIYQQKQQIMQKIRLLLDVNQSFKQQIKYNQLIQYRLEQQIGVLKQKGKIKGEIEKEKEKEDWGGQVEVGFDQGSQQRERLYSFGSGQSPLECGECSSLKNRITVMQEERKQQSRVYQQQLAKQEQRETEIERLRSLVGQNELQLRRRAEQAQCEGQLLRGEIEQLRDKIAVLRGEGQGWKEIGSVFDG